MKTELHGSPRPAAIVARRLHAVVALLAGCSSLAPAPHATTPALPRNYSESIDIGGRFSAQFQRAGKPESWNGNFNWTQSPQRTTVTLQSPFGQTLATIAVDRDSATLTQSGKAPRRAANVDALALNTLGWPLPVSNLRNWLQGFAVGTDGQTVTASPQSADTIATRDGWRIRYVSWQDDNGNHGTADARATVPKRIDMERNTDEAGNVQMRLVISEWQTH